MIRLISIIIAVSIIGYAIHWWREQQKFKEIEKMTPDELVEAIIKKEISILEVPANHREAVEKTLGEIQKTLDNV